MRSRPVSLLLFLLGLSLLPGVARAEGIRVQCVPGHLLLGVDREAEVRIQVDPSATGLELFVSAGELGPLTREGPGVYRAVYVPPRQKLPLQVIVTALGKGAKGVLDGWTVLPLWGQGEAEVRTRPGAPVTLQVGEQTFGPIEADASGLAHIPVKVPPGVHEAFFGRRRIDLGVPPQPFVHPVTERRELRADREETVNIRLYTLKPEGGPSRSRALSLSASRGSVSAPAELEPGVSIVRWTVPPGPVGILELKGSVSGEPRGTFGVRLAAVAGPPQHFEMRVDRKELVAAEEVRVAVEVSARDAVGNPAKAALRLEAELGSGAVLTERRPGEYTGALVLTPGFGGRETLELRLLAEGISEPVLTRTLTLRAAEPARVTLESLQPMLVADGKTEAVWRISVADRFGNPVREPRPQATPSDGSVSKLLPNEPGSYVLRYVPPEARVDHLSRLEVRAGQAKGWGELPLLHRRPVLLVAARAGLMTNFADVRAPSAGLRLEAWPMPSLPVVGVLLDTSYLRFSRTGGAGVPGFTGLNEQLDTTVALGLRTLRMQGIQGWVAAGPSLARVRSRATLGTGPELEEGTWVLGGQAMAGASLSLGRGQPFLEARFCWFADPSLHVLRGSLRGVGLSLGYRHEIF